MKNTVKTALIVSALAAAFSVNALALQPAAAPVASNAAAPTQAATPAPQAPIAAEEDAPATLYSKLNPEQAADIKKAKDVTQELDDLTRNKDKSSIELELIKLDLDKAKAREEIRKLKDQATAPEAATAQDLQSGVSLQPAATKAASKETPLDRVFVTQIYGLEGSEVATVFYENSIIKARSGDVVADGLRLEKVLSNGAVFSWKGKTKRVLMTTQEQAFSRSFSKQESSENDRDRVVQQQMPRMAMPMTPTPGN